MIKIPLKMPKKCKDCIFFRSGKDIDNFCILHSWVEGWGDYRLYKKLSKRSEIIDNIEELKQDCLLKEYNKKKKHKIVKK